MLGGPELVLAMSAQLYLYLNIALCLRSTAYAPLDQCTERAAKPKASVHHVVVIAKVKGGTFLGL